MTARIRYHFTAKIWQHNAEGGWFFVSLPKDISKEIRDNLKWQEEGWGRMKVAATVKDLTWHTAIWFDNKHDTYLLPLKAEIRKKAALQPGDTIDIGIAV